MEETFLAIQEDYKQMGLQINQSKTKYMVARNAYTPKIPSVIDTELKTSQIWVP